MKEVEAGKVVVLVNEHAALVWAQGADVETAQAEIERVAGVRMDWAESGRDGCDYSAYVADAREWDADDVHEIRESGDLIGHWTATEREGA